MDIPCIIQRMCGKSVLPVSSSRAKPRDLFRWRSDGECLRKRNGKHRLAGKVAGGASSKGLAKEAGKGGRKRFLAALEMTAWGMDIPMTAWGKWIPAVSYKVFAGEALIPYRHPGKACFKSQLSIYFHSTPCISNNYLFFQFGIFPMDISKKTCRK